MSTLYANFLNDPEVYARTEAFWNQRWEQLIGELGQQEAWQTPWFKTTFENGTPVGDGNPIFSALCPRRRLGLQVIQLDPSDNDLEFRAWADTFGADANAIRTLVVTCTLTERSAEQAIDAIKRWVTEQSVA